MSTLESKFDDICNIFADAEDQILEKSLLVGIAPEEMVGVQLQPEVYEDDSEERLKCNIVIECSDDIEISEDTMEEISDAVNDFLTDKGLHASLESLGVDPELLDWWPVSVEVA